MGCIVQNIYNLTILNYIYLKSIIGNLKFKIYESAKEVMGLQNEIPFNYIISKFIIEYFI